MLKIKSLSVPSAPLKMAENYTQEVCCIMAIQFHEKHARCEDHRIHSSWSTQCISVASMFVLPITLSTAL